LYKHAKDQPPKEILSIENTSKEVEQLKADIYKLKEENDIKINILAKVHYNELEEIRNEITALNRTLISNSDQYKSGLEQKDSELNQAIENLQNTKAKHVELVDTLKLEMLRQKKIIQINETRLTNKDDEMLKTHSVMDKLSQNVLIGEVRESELKQAVERITVFEEEALDPRDELVKEK
jgi:hypothetical protein